MAEPVRAVSASPHMVRMADLPRMASQPASQPRPPTATPSVAPAASDRTSEVVTVDANDGQQVAVAGSQDRPGTPKGPPQSALLDSMRGSGLDFSRDPRPGPVAVVERAAAMVKMAAHSPIASLPTPQAIAPTAMPTTASASSGRPADAVVPEARGQERTPKTDLPDHAVAPESPLRSALAEAMLRGGLDFSRDPRPEPAAVIETAVVDDSPVAPGHTLDQDVAFSAELDALDAAIKVKMEAKSKARLKFERRVFEMLMLNARGVPWGVLAKAFARAYDVTISKTTLRLRCLAADLSDYQRQQYEEALAANGREAPSSTPRRSRKGRRRNARSGRLMLKSRASPTTQKPSG